MSFYIRSKDLLDQKFTVNGDGTGNENANGVYTPGAPGIFYVQPASNKSYDLYEFEFTFTTSSAFEAAGYGNGAILTNGINLTINDDSGVVHDLINGSIVSNAGWGVFIDIDTLLEPGPNPGVLTGKSLFVARFGRPVRLFGAENQRIVLTYQDDMSARVTSQVAAVSGEVVNE